MFKSGCKFELILSSNFRKQGNSDLKTELFVPSLHPLSKEKYLCF